MLVIAFVLVLLAFVFEVIATFQSKLNLNTTISFIALGLACYFLSLLLPALAHLGVR